MTYINIMDTLQYMKPDIKVLVWDNDINRIEYNETEDFRPSKEEILAVDQSEVIAWKAQQVQDQNQVTLAGLQQQLQIISQQIQQLENL